MTTPTRAELRLLFARGTPKPWTTQTNPYGFGVMHRATDDFESVCYWDNESETENSEDNASLIIEAVNALPVLLDELDAKDALLWEVFAELNRSEQLQIRYAGLIGSIKASLTPAREA